ncbi:hypothetical protein ACFWP7_29665 [Streptomyces sp. NPDC058470]|uniref:hypothetical protein n=1 Tax=Streptomyces sp. NPDC058470 TaxID=3346515 RepID=UPI003646E22C
MTDARLYVVSGPPHVADRRDGRPAAHGFPRRVEILPDPPKTASGKILHRELRSRSHKSP